MFHKKTNIIFPQWFAGIAVALMILELGFMSGWASPTLARLTGPNSEIPLTAEQASWVASLVNLGRLFGAVIGAFSVNKFGSKHSILITLFPIALGWLMIAFANVVEWLYVARLSNGIGLGMAFSTFPLYVGEVSMPEIRGALISLAACGGPIGQIISSVCGSYLSVRMAGTIYLLSCLLIMVLFWLLPDSPHHLVKIGNFEAAAKSIKWYRAGKGVDVELEAVKKFVTSDGSETFVDKLKKFKTGPVKKATFQVIALYTFMQICGLNSVVFYMETILINANFNLINPSDVVIYVNVLGTLAAAISIFLIDRCGRRFLILLSSIGVSLSMFGLMSHFLLMEKGVNTDNLQYLPMCSMFLFIISFSVGLMPVPNAILSEIFPASIKCIAACIASLTGATMAFLSAKTYQPMVDVMGEIYVFMIYALCSVIVIPYGLFIMPETKGKSLLEIQDELVQK